MPIPRREFLVSTASLAASGSFAGGVRTGRAAFAGAASARGRRRVIALVACGLVASVVGAQHLLARPDMAAFDPTAMGRIEARMWRRYYEGRWLQLGCGALGAACEQYGFSWWDGTRLALDAVRAAAAFRVRQDDPVCLPALTHYYGIVHQAAPARFAPVDAARLELRWWSERREDVPPSDYAVTVARLTAMLYGLPTEAALPSAAGRVDAMVYRDARGTTMTDADWQEVERRLVAAYADLAARLAGHHAALEAR
jgi:hypothetical protein